jgi:hypothetical protein
MYGRLFIPCEQKKRIKTAWVHTPFPPAPKPRRVMATQWCQHPLVETTTLWHQLIEADLVFSRYLEGRRCERCNSKFTMLTRVDNLLGITWAEEPTPLDGTKQE